MIKQKSVKLSEIYCSFCGELKVIKQKDIKKYKQCFFCGSKDINEA